ncbi:MAG: hypothetical protein IH957_09505 [Chloroflexi bacterium]|nr:hypothetical protein [Chloroflexota bacterium]
MSILSVLKRRGKTQGEVEDVTPSPTTSPAPSLPPLILLSSDAAGPSVRRLHAFPDAETAADHIDFWFPASQRHDIIAFWALPNAPAAHQSTSDSKGGADSHRASVESAPPTEPPHQIIVVVQHPDYEDSVYPFSFPDLQAANRFVLQEMKRGLDLRSVHIYWATFVEIGTEPNGAVTITPSQPPVAGPIESEDADTAPEPDIAPTPVPEPQPLPTLTPEIAPQPQPTPTHDPIAAYQPPNEPTTLNEIIRDLARVLNVGRPDEPAGAFQGFGSPPDRF